MMAMTAAAVAANATMTDNYDNNDDGEGKCSPTGKGLYYLNDNVFLDDILMMIMSRSIFDHSG
jgi:hypothetical protein